MINQRWPNAFIPELVTSQWSDAAMANPFPPEGTDQAGVHVVGVCVCVCLLEFSAPQSINSTVCCCPGRRLCPDLDEAGSHHRLQSAANDPGILSGLV